jgi:hypothetical protein
MRVREGDPFSEKGSRIPAIYRQIKCGVNSQTSSSLKQAKKGIE